MGRALLRTTLARHLEIGPDLITFSREPHGRPFLPPTRRNGDLQFNLSYTDGLVAVALISGARVGLDIENTTTRIDCLDIARTCFCRAEYEELKALAGPRRNIRFFELWTQKEAYMKALGLGLNMALDEVSFASSGTTTRPVFTLRRDGGCWLFRLLNPSVAHQAAVCIGAPSENEITMTYKKVIPLAGEESLSLPAE